MSRLRRALHGVASSYILLGATAVYSLASVPVALHYLDAKRFGLWAVMGTLVGYLNLVDAGISSAVSRLLIDQKDNRNGGSYGSLIKTGWLVSVAQGGIIFCTGQIFAGIFAQLLEITPNLQQEFTQLVHWQCGVLALTFAARVFNLILGANQRMDWVNYLGIANLVVNFAVQWLLFYLGFGVLSLAGGMLAAAVLATMMQGLVCHRLELLPQPGSWGRPTWLHFWELFNYGKNAFLVAVGTQLVLASQVIVITRLLGLEAAAVWSVGMRMFNLLSQVGWRFSDMSSAALAEMMARGEQTRLRERYRSLAIIKFSFTGWLAISFAACNSLFVSIWTHDKIHWPAANDWLLALWMIVCSVVHCHNSLIGLTKQFRIMPYVYLLEGIVFVTLSYLVGRWGGSAAIIGCSIVCSTAFSGAYGVRRVCGYFNLAVSEVAWEWLQPMTRMLLFYVPVALLVWWLPLSDQKLVHLGLSGIVAGTLGVFLFLRYGVPAAFQNEILGRVSARMGSVLKRVFLKPSS